MKILYDHQIFSSQKYGGISRYFYELIDHLQINTHTEISLKISNNYYIKTKNYTQHIDFLPNIDFKGKRRLIDIVNIYNSNLYLKKQNFDIFHPTYYNPYFLPYLKNKPFVLTIHDMIHEKFHKIFKPNDRTSEQKKILAQKATKIIAISQNTKKDIIELLKIDESKVDVVYLGNSIMPLDSNFLKINIPKKYLLFVGLRTGYKNFQRFIKSVVSTLKKDQELFIVCAGGGKFTREENELFSKLKITKQVVQKDLDDISLTFFYKNALAFIFPSLYEGFGIPILESFACNCPLICSATSSFPEIAQDGAYYFDPYSEESIRNAIESVIKSNKIQNDLIFQGAKQLKKFSWQITAEKTKKIYESMM